MKKFRDFILEKKSTKNVDFNQELIQDLLKKHDEIDIITKDNERYFITSFMHDKNGIIHDGNNVGFKALDKKGKQVEVMYSDIKGAEY